MLLADDDTCFEMLSGDAPDRGERQRRFPAESGFCATQAAESRRPVFVGSFNELQEQFWRSASIAADGGYVSSATLPLLVEGTAIGVLAFNFTVPVNFDAEYQALLVSVAQHCAQALDRARLYDSAQRARAEAENANRLKDEFVSIVSHELRTPLNAMVGWTSMLQNGSLDSTTSARALQSIHDNATRQAKLIEELLDFSKLKSGRMTLDRDEIDLHDLLRGIVESIIPSVAAKGLDLEVPSVPSLRIYGDPRRLEQVFFNLLGNAMKFTPRGGRVSVAVRAVDRFAEIRVSDTGAGIDPGSCPTSSTASGRPTAMRPERTTASDSVSPSRKSSWKPTTVASRPRALDGGVGPPSSSACRSRLRTRRFAASSRRRGRPRGRWFTSLAVPRQRGIGHLAGDLQWCCSHLLSRLPAVTLRNRS